jgi:hypothetical protein
MVSAQIAETRIFRHWQLFPMIYLVVSHLVDESVSGAEAALVSTLVRQLIETALIETAVLQRTNHPN